MIGTAIAPNATGAVLATSATRRRLERPEAQRDQHHRADRHRRAEPGERLEQRAEGERDDDRLDPLVVADLRERAAQHVEVAGLDGQVVDPDRVDHDPEDREEAERRAFAAAPAASGRRGIEYTAIATTIATASEISDASHARIRSTPSRTNSTSSGSAANERAQAERVADGIEYLAGTSDTSQRRSMLRGSAVRTRWAVPPCMRGVEHLERCAPCRGWRLACPARRSDRRWRPASSSRGWR